MKKWSEKQWIIQSQICTAQEDQATVSAGPGKPSAENRSGSICLMEEIIPIPRQLFNKTQQGTFAFLAVCEQFY